MLLMVILIRTRCIRATRLVIHRCSAASDSEITKLLFLLRVLIDQTDPQERWVARNTKFAYSIAIWVRQGNTALLVHQHIRCGKDLILGACFVLYCTIDIITRALLAHSVYCSGIRGETYAVLLFLLNLDSLLYSGSNPTRDRLLLIVCLSIWKLWMWRYLRSRIILMSLPCRWTCLQSTTFLE